MAEDKKTQPPPDGIYADSLLSPVLEDEYLRYRKASLSLKAVREGLHRLDDMRRSLEKKGDSPKDG